MNEDLSSFDIPNLDNVIVKTSDVVKLQKMIQLSDLIDKSNAGNLTKSEAALYQSKSSELLNSFDLTDIDITDGSDIIPLLIASALGYIDFLAKWRSHGLSLNVADIEGKTPLHYIAENPYNRTNILSTIKFLLQCGLNPNARNDDGWTPVNFILFNYRNTKEDFMRTVEELIQAGADINCLNNAGRTPLYYVFYNIDSSSFCAESLLNLGADVNVEHEECVLDDYIKYFEGCAESNRFTTEHILQILTCAGVFVRHVVRMKVMGLYVSETVDLRTGELLRSIERVKRVYEEVRDRCNFDKDAIDKYGDECEVEKKKLKTVKLDDCNSLYSLATKSEGEIYTFAYKKVYQDYFSDNEYREDFPIYWFILRLQYNAANDRKLLLPDAKAYLESFNLPLDDDCLDHVLKFFSNRELDEFIKSSNR